MQGARIWDKRGRRTIPFKKSIFKIKKTKRVLDKESTKGVNRLARENVNAYGLRCGRVC
jgi:hypothetical protein